MCDLKMNEGSSSMSLIPENTLNGEGILSSQRLTQKPRCLFKSRLVLLLTLIVFTCVLFTCDCRSAPGGSLLHHVGLEIQLKCKLRLGDKLLYPRGHHGGHICVCQGGGCL